MNRALFGSESAIRKTAGASAPNRPGREIRFVALGGAPWLWVFPPEPPGRPGPPDRDGTDEPSLVTLISRLNQGNEALYSPTGEIWSVGIASSVRLEFRYPTGVRTERDRYAPDAVLIGRDGEEVRGALFIAQGRLLSLDETIGRGLLLDHADAAGFLRLAYSRQSLSREEIDRGLTRSRISPGVLEIVPPETSESRGVLPQLILQIREGENGTDLHPLFEYDDGIFDPGRPDRGNPAPRRRQRAEENRLIAEVEAVLDEDLAWRRGRYSGHAGTPMAPFRVDLPLLGLLDRHGRALLEGGVQIRLDNRPVWVASKLRLSARAIRGMMDISAGVELDGTLIPIDFDVWFDKGGLGRSRDAYFILKKTDLDQLAILRRHGLSSGGFLRTSPDNFGLVDALFAQLVEQEGDAPLHLTERRNRYSALMNPEIDIPETSPEGLRTALRPYQLKGYSWLLRLRSLGLGGCLADDMGLGKTVQTLAYLLRLEEQHRLGPVLLVGPVITLSNWEAELRRFAPSLTFRRYAGRAGQRDLPDSFEDIRVVIVSYQTLRNDIGVFVDHEWDTIILDEAHYVKNASSKTFKAVRTLKGKYRLSLTGTPLENHLSELWAQLNFLEPGLFGGHQGFQDRYGRPVERGDAAALKDLRRITAPFILRRTKDEVLPDLPAKDETVIRCAMTPGQTEIYAEVADLYRRQINGLIDDRGFSGARIEILALITKLRLLAIHPALADESFSDVESGKMLLLERLLEEIVDEGHRTLVFSQFLGALDQTESICRHGGWDYARLDGSTKDRDGEIRRFSEESGPPVFLLSLRAGGVGINLTAADFVLLLDPWWNPAVEAQAIDRAHRIGQKRPVMVYRLISAGTVEEKVRELQESKRRLFENVLDGDATGPFTEDEVRSLFE